MTATDVSSGFIIVYHIASQNAITVARVVINIMAKHAYLPTTVVSDKGSAFLSQVIKEVEDVLGIDLEHGTTKDAQTIAMLGWTHASVQKAMKIETGERR